MHCNASHPRHPGLRCTRPGAHRAYSEEHRALPAGQAPATNGLTRWTDATTAPAPAAGFAEGTGQLHLFDQAGAPRLPFQP